MPPPTLLPHPFPVILREARLVHSWCIHMRGRDHIGVSSPQADAHACAGIDPDRVRALLFGADHSGPDERPRLLGVWCSGPMGLAIRADSPRCAGRVVARVLGHLLGDARGRSSCPGCAGPVDRVRSSSAANPSAYTRRRWTQRAGAGRLTRPRDSSQCVCAHTGQPALTRRCSSDGEEGATNQPEAYDTAHAHHPLPGPRGHLIAALVTKNRPCVSAHRAVIKAGAGNASARFIDLSRS